MWTMGAASQGGMISYVKRDTMWLHKVRASADWGD